MTLNFHYVTRSCLKWFGSSHRGKSNKYEILCLYNTRDLHISIIDSITILQYEVG